MMVKLLVQIETERLTAKGACVMSSLFHFCKHNRTGQILWVCHFMTGESSNPAPSKRAWEYSHTLWSGKNSPRPLCFQHPDEAINRPAMQRATEACENGFIKQFQHCNIDSQRLEERKMLQKSCTIRNWLNFYLVKNTAKCSCGFIPDRVSKLIELSLVHQIRFINNCQISKGYLPEK